VTPYATARVGGAIENRNRVENLLYDSRMSAEGCQSPLIRTKSCRRHNVPVGHVRESACNQDSKIVRQKL